jgi:hypothetical protein
MDRQRRTVNPMIVPGSLQLALLFLKAGPAGGSTVASTALESGHSSLIEKPKNWRRRCDRRSLLPAGRPASSSGSLREAITGGTGAYQTAHGQVKITAQTTNEVPVTLYVIL